MSEEAVKRCPECRGKVKRLIGAGSGILFKGSGFYETDYRSKSYSEAAGKESKGKTESDKSKKDKASGSSSAPDSGQKKDSSTK